MSETLRLFVAIDLPSEVKTLLGDLERLLQPALPAVRWADPHGTHLTLKFLGEVARSDQAAIEAEMRSAAAAHEPFHLQTGTLGVFPNARQARVIWLGLDGESAALTGGTAIGRRSDRAVGVSTRSPPVSATCDAGPHASIGDRWGDAGDRTRDSIHRCSVPIADRSHNDRADAIGAAAAWRTLHASRACRAEPSDTIGSDYITVTV